jgi:uncharacterized membrane protein YfcA
VAAHRHRRGVAGTWLGGRLLPYIPHALFRRVVAALVGTLGLVMLWRSFDT